MKKPQYSFGLMREISVLNFVGRKWCHWLLCKILPNSHLASVDYFPIIGLNRLHGNNDFQGAFACRASAKNSDLATIGNLNNHTRSAFELATESTWALEQSRFIEMGANKQGAIKELCWYRRAYADGFITNIGKAPSRGMGGPWRL